MKKRVILMVCCCFIFSTIFCYIETYAVQYRTLPNKQITTFVRAKFTGEDLWIGDSRYIKFKTREIMFGDTEDEFWLRDICAKAESKKDTSSKKLPEGADAFGYSSYNFVYEKEQEYLLLASKHLNVYMPFDYFEPKDNFFFPVENPGSSECFDDDLRVFWCEYMNYSLWNNVEPGYPSDDELFKTFINNVVEYLSQTSEGKPFYGIECIRTDDLTIIEAKAPDIIRVYVKNKESERTNAEVRECKVLEVIKGNCDDAEIFVDFCKDDVKYSGEYIIYAISRYGSTKRYYLYAPHAVKTVKEPWVGTVMTVVSIVVAAVCGVAVILAGVLISVFKLRKKA